MYMKKFLFIIIAILLLAGCSTKDQVEDEQDDETVMKDTDGSSGVFPLTGISTKEENARRAVAVMINNHPQARPQSGLSEADIVYELLAEGDITRLLAVFQSETPEQIGPVRSARDYYIELAKGLDCLYVCHGNSPEAKTMLDKGYIDNLNGLYYDGSLFQRTSDRKAPHNSYTSFDNIEKGAEEKDYDLKGAPEPFAFLTEEEEKGLQGEIASKIDVIYGESSSNVQYEYEKTEEKYTRYSDGEQTVEYQSAKPVLLDNIFIIEAAHQVVDNKGRRKIDLKSGGKGYLLQKGKINEVDWVNEDERIIPMKNGKEVGLVTGKTWVNVIPTSPGLDKSVSFSQ